MIPSGEAEGAGGATTSATRCAAWANSLGMIQSLFDSPWAICGSICRYW